MHSAIKILPHYTYDDYCNWEGRWELLEGIPYAMSPAPLPKHQRMSAIIMSALINAIKKAGCKKCTVYNFIDIKITEDTIVQPDVVVACNEIKKPFLDFPAALVVEILSPATAMKDRNNKFYLYQSQKIPYYIIIDVDKNEIEIYHLKENDQYNLEKINVDDHYTFHLDADCSINVLLNNIWE